MTQDVQNYILRQRHITGVQSFPTPNMICSCMPGAAPSGWQCSQVALILRLAFAFALVIPSMISVKAEVIKVRTQTQAEALVVQTCV